LASTSTAPWPARARVVPWPPAARRARAAPHRSCRRRAAENSVKTAIRPAAMGRARGEPRLLGRQEQNDDPGHHEPAGQGYGRPHEDSQQCRQRSHDVRAVLAKDERTLYLSPKSVTEPASPHDDLALRRSSAWITAAVLLVLAGALAGSAQAPAGTSALPAGRCALRHPSGRPRAGSVASSRRRTYSRAALDERMSDVVYHRYLGIPRRAAQLTSSPATSTSSTLPPAVR